MADGLLALIVQRHSNVSQSTSSSYNSCMSCCIDSHAVEAAHVDNQMPILPSKTMRGIAVTSTLCSDSNAARNSTRHSILNMFDCLWYGVGSRYVW
jgi:hypothetical protein